MAVRDFDRAARRLEEFGRQANVEIGDGLRVIGESIMADVKAAAPGRGVPVDIGTLRSTGKVTGPFKEHPDVAEQKVRLSFGGPAAPYAVVQHERIDYRHDIGEARYLVRGLDRFVAVGLRGAPDAMAAIQNGTRRAAERSKRLG